MSKPLFTSPCFFPNFCSFLGQAALLIRGRGHACSHHHSTVHAYVCVCVCAHRCRLASHPHPLPSSPFLQNRVTDATACAALFGCMHSCLHPPAPCGTQHKNNHMDTFASQYKRTQRQVHVHLRMNYVYLQQQSLKAPQPALVSDSVSGSPCIEILQATPFQYIFTTYSTVPACIAQLKRCCAVQGKLTAGVHVGAIRRV